MKGKRLIRMLVLFLINTRVFELLAQPTGVGASAPESPSLPANVNVSLTNIDQFRVKAGTGDAEAEYRLGIFYFNRAGLADSKVQAATGDLRARDTHPETTQDYTEAAKWFRKAAEQGESDAQNLLGAQYRDGKGVSQNYREAVAWLRRSAKQGNFYGQLNIAGCYEDGTGVPQDFIEAYKWYALASAENGSASARDSLGSKMTAEQIAEAQRLSAAFIPRKEKSSLASDNLPSPNNPTASGTGFFITEDGYLITNNHVVKDATKVRLVTNSGLIDATIVRLDAGNDLALLKAEGRFAPLSIASSRTVKLGGVVATVGFPDIGLQGFAPKFARGEIASLSGASDDARYFQISVPVQPGNSGGALVDVHGNVVGVVSAKLDAVAALEATGALPENVNYAVKSSFVLSFLESVPEISAKLKEPLSTDRKFDEVVQSAQHAAVLVLVY